MFPSLHKMFLIIIFNLLSSWSINVTLAQVTTQEEMPPAPQGTVVKPTSQDGSFLGGPLTWDIVNGVVATLLIVSGLTVGFYHYYSARFDKARYSQNFHLRTPQSRFTDYNPDQNYWWYSYPTPTLQPGLYDVDFSLNSKFDDRPASNRTDVEEVARGNFVFTGNLHRSLNSKSKDNSVFSPWSISTLMAIIKLGAGGQTAYEIERGLGLPRDDQVLVNGFSKVTQFLKGNYTLTSANRLYAQNNFELQPNFEKLSSEQFGADIRQVNFMDSVTVAAEINDWVSDSTHGKIQNLVSSDDFTPFTRLVLVNGVYFKGFWKSPFNPQSTRKMDFYVSELETLPVDMMVKESAWLKFKFLPQIDAHILVLPYEGERLSMILYVPRERTGLTRVENGLGGGFLFKNILREMPAEQKVDIYLPKFKIEATMNFVEPLRQLGLRSMFLPGRANFSGISTNPQHDLYVSQVVQKAFIEVNEAGTEAAAATAGFMLYTMLPPPVPKIIVDRPFAFQIWDQETNFVLFGGRFLKP